MIIDADSSRSRGERALSRDAPPVEPSVQPGDITTLLQRWRDDPLSAQRLLRAVTPRLRRIAARQLSALPHESLPVSDLTQEALLPLLAQRSVRFGNSGHFFATAGYLMRRLLIDRIRKRATPRHGGGLRRAAVDMLAIRRPEAHPDLLALEEALVALERVDPEAARIVELRYFCGLSIDDTAAALGLGRSTVVRSWRWARTWLQDRLGVRHRA